MGSPPLAPTPTFDTPALPRRGEAIGCGLGCGVVGTAILVAIAAWVASKHDSSTSTAAGWLVTAGALATVIGLCLRASAASDDAANHRRQSAPHLPLDLAEEGTPVWISGTVFCPRPVVAPMFDVRCAWLRVLVEKGSGKNKKVVRKSDHAPRVWIENAGRRVELDRTKVSLQRLDCWSASDDGVRTTATFLRAGDSASAWGVIRRERRPPAPPPSPGATNERLPAGKSARIDVVFELKSLRDSTGPRPSDDDPDPAAGPEAEEVLVLGGAPDLPAMVAPVSRHDWTQHVETEELQARTMGTVFLLTGATVAAGAAGQITGLWRGPTPEMFAGGAAASVVVVSPILGFFAWRRLRACRRRADEAAEALETDLRNASDRESAAATRVAARLAVYDQLATEHNDLLARFPMSWIARVSGDRPMPLQGNGQLTMDNGQ